MSFHTSAFALWRSIGWLSRTALVVLAGILGAVALSVGLWWQDGSPEVSASFGGQRGGFGQGPGRGGPPNGGFPQRGPGQGGQQPGQVPGGQGGLPNQGRPGGVPNDTSLTPIEGTIQAFGQGNLSLRTSTGERFVRVSPSTQIIRSDGSTGSLSDLRPGSSVEVTTAPGINVLTATEVRLLSR